MALFQAPRDTVKVPNEAAAMKRVDRANHERRDMSRGVAFDTSGAV
ncbi:MAG: hypothetical protein HC800_08270 [Phormidesmis sp. RL_2_1]|nr:hypothetical protein [Phormidesmis sp. RL_2_1]